MADKMLIVKLSKIGQTYLKLIADQNFFLLKLKDRKLCTIYVKSQFFGLDTCVGTT